MKIFLAGATGVLGRRLVTLLVEDGHKVVGTTRGERKVAALTAAGAEPVVLDLLDADAVARAVAAAEPDVVVHQATALAAMTGNPKRFDAEFATTNLLRTTGTDNLLSAARANGVSRVVAQSYTGWPNERRGSRVKDESDPLDPDPAAGSEKTLAAIAHLEQTVTAAQEVDGVVLRYGAFYGAGTGLGKGGGLLDLVAQRKLPVVGNGAGVWSFCHVDDAAAATARAVTHGAPGLYNICDDDPAPVAEWLPHLAHCIGAAPPRRIPAWLARPLVGEHGVSVMTQVRGSSNAKARRELGWAPSYPSWRDGFRSGLG